MGKVRLKKDIVIPAGTVFEDVRGMKVEYGQDNYEHTIGLTKDSSGSLVYGFERADPAMWDWFEECESELRNATHVPRRELGNR